jgi:hypothetical protein
MEVLQEETRGGEDQKCVRRRQPLPAVGTGRGDIGQLADVAAGQGGNDGEMEIRIILDRAEPPAGRLRAVPDPGHCHAVQDEEIRFTGWLGLLRALYEVTGGPGGGSVPVP